MSLEDIDSHTSGYIHGDKEHKDESCPKYNSCQLKDSFANSTDKDHKDFHNEKCSNHGSGCYYYSFLLTSEGRL